MEIKLSVLFFCFIALPGVATQCPSGGKVSLTSGMQLTSLHKDNCLKLKFIYLFKCIEFTLIYFVFRTMRGSGRMREIPRWSEETRCRVITEYLLEVFHCSYFCIIFLIIPDILGWYFNKKWFWLSQLFGKISRFDNKSQTVLIGWWGIPLKDEIQLHLLRF